MESREEPKSAIRAFLAQALALRELAHVALALILLFAVAIPVAHALRMGPVWPSIFGFVLVLAVARIPLNRKASLIAIAVCVLVYLTLQLLVLNNHWVDPVSDFKRQWSVAVDWVHNGLGEPTSPQTQRALPFYYPLVKVFGADPAVYLAANVVLTTSTYLMAVHVARRFFGLQGAAKTAMLLLFGFEPLFANTFPSHDVLGSFGVLVFLTLLVEIEQIVDAGRFTHKRAALLGTLAFTMSLTITWVDWQRTMGMFCMFAVLFYGVASIVKRAPRARLRIAIAVLVCLFSVLEGCGLKSCELTASQPPTQLTSTPMSLLVFGSDEGDGRFSDWFRNARMASALRDAQVTNLSKGAVIESLRNAPRRKYRNFLARQLNFLNSGQDSGWYLTIQDPEWVSAKQLRAVYKGAEKWTPPVWWAIALLLVTAAMFRREVLFDYRCAPLILIGSFMAVMGLVGESQARYAMFLVFLWPIYAGAAYVANPLPIKKIEDTKRAGLAVARVALGIVVVIAIPVLVLSVSPLLIKARTANFHDATFLAGKTPGATALGVPPRFKSIRSHLVVADSALGSEGWTVTSTSKVEALKDNSELIFVLYNEIAEPLEFPEKVKQDRPEDIAGRTLRVIVDGGLRLTLDLSKPFVPRSFEIPGFAAGEHEVRFELDLGGKHRQTLEDKCNHRWTSPDVCTNTSIAYLGFY